MKWRRREAIIRDDYACQECGALGGRKGDTKLHVHHRTPVSEGGSDALENLDTLCDDCHRENHSENPVENDGWFERKHSDDEILAYLREHDGAGTTDVADAFDYKQPSAYRRLKRLEDEGWVRSRRVGGSLFWQATTEGGRDA